MKRTDGQTDGLTDGRMDGRTDGRTNERTQRLLEEEEKEEEVRCLTKKKNSLTFCETANSEQQTVDLGKSLKSFFYLSLFLIFSPMVKIRCSLFAVCCSLSHK